MPVRSSGSPNRIQPKERDSVSFNPSGDTNNASPWPSSILLAKEATAKSSRSRPAIHSRVFLVSSTTAVGIGDGGGGNGDGGVQLADNLKIFKADNFDLDV
uniref:Uncharacterized protein n=1 Tax=Zea mays TaxID=4577 RepID=A0A804PC76_MAIZE